MAWTGRRDWTRLGRVPTDVAGLWPAPQCETRRCTPEKQFGGCIVDLTIGSIRSPSSLVDPSDSVAGMLLGARWTVCAPDVLD